MYQTNFLCRFILGQTVGERQGKQFLFHLSIIRICGMSCVRLSVRLTSCRTWQNLYHQTLHTKFSSSYFHTCHAYRHYCLLPLYTTFTDLDLGWGHTVLKQFKLNIPILTVWPICVILAFAFLLLVCILLLRMYFAKYKADISRLQRENTNRSIFHDI